VYATAHHQRTILNELRGTGVPIARVTRKSTKYRMNRRITRNLKTVLHLKIRRSDLRNRSLHLSRGGGRSLGWGFGR
jgi:hypothetical protein